MVSRKWWLGVAVTLAAVAGAPVWAQDDKGTQAAEAADDGPSGQDAMFEYLVAEFAAQRGDVDGALAIYERLAKELRDPAIAKRAVETAIRAREFGPALDNATLLLELDPDSTLAREIIAALLANEGDLAKARGLVEGILAKTDNRGPVLMQLAHLFGKFREKKEVLEATLAVTQPYRDMPEAHYANGVAALLAGNSELAMKESDAALETKPEWEPGAILKAQVLRKTNPDGVVPFYQSFVAAHPDS